MKLQKRGIIAGIFVIFLTFGLGGCTKATPENILKGMAKKMASVQSAETNIKMKMAASGDSLGEEAELAMDVDVDMQANQDSGVAYIKGEISVDFMGQKESLDLESYTVEEEGKYISYVRSETDEWHKQEADNALMEDNLEFLKGLYEGFELKEGLKKVGNDECYVLTSELGGKETQGILASVIQMMDTSAGMFSGVNWDEVIIPVEIYIVKKTQLPAKLIMDGKSLMQAVFGNQELAVEVDTYTFELTYSSFDSVDIIEVPDEVKESAAVSTGVLDDDLNEEEVNLIPSDEVLEGTEQAAELGASWDSMTVSINGKVVTLPCTYEQLRATGLEPDGYGGATKDAVIAAEDTKSVNFGVPGSDAGSILAEIYNTSEQPIKLSNGIVTDITFLASDAGDIEVVFPGNITIDKTLDEVIAVYGEADHSDTTLSISSWYINTDEGEICVFIKHDEETKKIDYMSMYYLMF